jgi:Ca2+/Na+ antiporter
MLGSTAFLALFSITGWRINRAEGATLVLAYVAYVTVSLA